MHAAWMDDALCVGGEPNDWFPISEHAMSEDNTKALAACQVCPVRIECAEWAITNRLDYGIYGGMHASERARIQRARKPKVRKQDGAWTVTSEHQQAATGSWTTALSFALKIAN
jgi:WhiB family transcriptional regulator, redox-sensing transcriptional regulator